MRFSGEPSTPAPKSRNRKNIGLKPPKVIVIQSDRQIASQSKPHRKRRCHSHPKQGRDWQQQLELPFEEEKHHDDGRTKTACHRSRRPADQEA
jgi:hypothetical protein